MAESVYSKMFTRTQLYDANRRTRIAAAKSAAEEEQRLKEERENANIFEKVGYTALDFVTELGGGLLKTTEGVLDLGVGLTGKVSDWLGGDSDWAKKFIKKDLTQKYYYSWEDDLTNKSKLNDWETAKGVVRGLGQQLPVIVGYAIGAFASGATGGTSMAAANAFAKAWYGITAASAGGQGMEEALNDGASFDKSLIYGFEQAGIEALMEAASAKLGVGMHSITGNIGKTTAKSVGKIMVEEGLSEAFEEGMTALANPITKATYKGKDALDVYRDMSFYLDAGQEALIGGLVGSITAGASGLVSQRQAGGNVRFMMTQSISELEALDRKEQNLFNSGKLSKIDIDTIQTQRQAELENISLQLQKLSQDERLKFIKEYNLSNYFDSNGEIIQQDSETSVDGQIVNQGQNIARKPLISDNIQAYSPSLRNTKLILPPTSNALSAGAIQAKKFLSALNPGAKMVITDNMPNGVNSFYDTTSKIYYFSNNITTSKLVGHEVTHSLEGTKEYKALADYVLSNINNVEDALAKKVEQYKNVNTEAKSGKNGNEVALYEAQTELVAEEMGKLLSDQDSINRVVNQNKGVAYRLWQWVKDVVAKLTTKRHTGAYYDYVRNAEKLFAKALETSYGGISLTEIAKLFEADAKASLDNDAKLRYSIRRNNLWQKLTDEEQAKLYKNVDELRLSNNYKNRLDNGDYLFDVGRKIVISDGELQSPSIEGIVEFNQNFPNKISDARDYFYEKINNGRTIQESVKFINDLYQEKVAIFHGGKNSKYNSDGGKQRRSVGADRDDSSGEQRGTGSKNVRYSLSQPIRPGLVEDIRYALNSDSEIKDLVAVHNTTESKLLQSIELGGLPMPSIAIIKNNMSHEHFGNISLILKSDAIDPGKNYDNKVYSADAYSPRFPRVDYSLNGKELRALADKLDTSVAMLEANDFAEGNSRERIIDSLKNNDNFLRHYLKEFNIKEEVAYKSPSYSNAIYMRDEVKEFLLKNYSFDEVLNNKEVQNELAEVVQKAKNNQEKDFKKNMLQKSYENLIAQFEDARHEKYIYDIVEAQYNYDKQIAQGKVDKVEDSYQTRRNTLDKLKNDAHYNNYVEESVDKVLDKKYLRNNKDYYTSSGNPRSFEALHEEYNAENAVRLMKELGGKNSEGANLFGYGLGEIKAALSKIYYSISEIHQDKHILQDASEDSSAMYEDCNNELHEIANQISERINTGNFLEERDIALNAIFDIIASTKTNEQAKRLIKRDYTFEIKDSEILKIRKLAEKVAELPVKYFEAKPERVVNFNEIVKVFVPENTNVKILDFFEYKGIDVEIYNETKPTRQDLLKNLPQDVRFSLKDGEGEYVYSKGQISKYVAEHSKVKAYLKSDAERIVNSILSNYLTFGEKYGEVRGKTKEQVVNTLWHALNTKGEGYRNQTALDIADFVIDNAVVEDIYSDNDNYYDEFIVGKLSEYIKSVDLTGLNEEIRHKFDNKAVSIYSTWGKRKGTRGQSPDQIAMELAESGIQLQANNPADILFEMNDIYRRSKDRLKSVEKERLSDILGDTQRNELKQSIALEILAGYDETGHKTKFIETIERYTNKISELKAKVKDVNAYNKAKNGLISTIERLRDEFVKNKPAAWEVPQQVVDFVRTISKVETWRNNISKSARQYIAQLESKIDLIMDETQKEIYPYREVISELGNASKGELTTDEFILLDAVLRQFAWQLRNYDRVAFEGKVQKNTTLSMQGVKETKQAKGIVKDGSRVLSRFKNSVYVNPRTRMAEMGLYRSNSIMMRLYNEMLRGDSRRAQFTQNADALYKEFFKENKKYLESLQDEITIGTGNDALTLSKRQAITLYMTSLREQGQMHLFNIDIDTGVVRLLDNKLSTQGKNAEAFSKGVDVRINRRMINEIRSKLTAADKKYIQLTRKFFNENSRNAKEEVDKQLYGITNVESGDYFPLKVSKDKIYTQAGQLDTNTNQYILNLGINKSVKTDANNKLVIDGVDNIVANHIREMSMYYGYAMPLTAYNRIMNKQVDSADGADTTTNMRGEIAKIDSTFEKYMDKLWKDVQGISGKQKGFVDTALSYIRWAGANSALGLNPKVLTTQTLSLAAAVAEFNPKYIAKGMGHFFGEKQKAELAKYSPLMWERMEQGHSVDVQEIRQIGKEIAGKFGKVSAKVTKALNNLSTKPISWMDSNVIQSLWFAAQYEVADTKGKGYEFGTEANKIEAGKRVDQVVFTTQQTSDPLGRSAWMRSENEIVKFARMFTGDAIQLTGKLIASVDQLSIAKKMIKSKIPDLVEEGQALKKVAQKALIKSASAFILNQSMLLAIAMAFKWIKGKDDDEEWSDVAKKEATANLMGLIPFGADMFEKWQGYEPSNMAYTALGDTVETVQDTYEIISTLIKGDHQSEVARNAMIRKSALSISRLLGIPTQNVESYVKGIVGKASPGAREEYEALFKTKSNKVYLEKIKRATENGDEELADTLINIMFDSKTGKIKDDNVLSVTRDLIEKGYDVVPKNLSNKITYNGTTYNLTNKQYKAFKIIYSQANNSIKVLVNNIYFKRLSDEAKAKAMQFIYNYYYDLAVEDLVGEDTDNKAILFVNAIPVEQLALAVAQASVLEADKDKKGNSIIGTRKTKVQQYVQSLRLTAVQKYIIMGYLGYTNTNGSSNVWSYINRLNLSKDEKNKLYEKSGYSTSK